MASDGSYARLRDALRDDLAALRTAWFERYRRSPIRLPGGVPDGDVSQIAAPILESLAEALAPSGRGQPAPPRDGGQPAPRPADGLRFSPGSALLREVEKSAAFVGATLGPAAATGFDVAALVFALRDVLLEYVTGEEARALSAWAEWMAVVALDAFASARGQSARERIRDELERGTPVVLVTQDVPAAFLIGSPDAAVVDAALSRLLLLTVRVGAPAIIIDAAGLVDACHPVVIESLHQFLCHPKIAGRVELAACGLDGDSEPVWRDLAERAGCAVHIAERFDFAVAHALERVGAKLVRPSGP